MSEINDTFKFSLKGKDSLASKWIEQKRPVKGTLKDDGAGVFAIGDYIYEVFCIDKLTSGQITKNNFYARIRDLNNLTNESIVKFEDVIDIPFVHQIKKITKVPNISFASISESLGKEKINSETQTVSDLLTAEEMKIMAINYFHIRYDRREKEGIKDKTYDEILGRPILYFGTDTELEFIIPDYKITKEEKVIESSTEAPIAISVTENVTQPEVNNTVVEGYFYKRSTGQADKKNASYSGISKKVYSVEDFKESYTTKDCIDLDLTISDYKKICDIVKKEGKSLTEKEYKCIAFTSFNACNKKKSNWYTKLKSISSVTDISTLDDSVKTAEANLTRRAVIYVAEGNEDITKGATKWDGEDFLAFGNCETKYDANKTGSNKFREYKFIEIPKSVYDSYSAAISFPLTFRCFHDESKCTGTHTHFDGSDGKRRAKYLAIASTFTDTANWKDDVFYIETSVNTTLGISGTIAAGKTIFWKETKDSLNNQ